MSLQCHRDMFAEVFNDDGLLVMARGLGVEAVMLKFIKLHSGGKELVFILNSYHNYQVRGHDSVVRKAGGGGHNPARIQVLCDKLLEAGIGYDALPTRVDNETAASERKNVYKRGGCVLATSRILIVDLLTGRLSGEGIGGFLVGKAHQVTATSREAFILQIFRDSTRQLIDEHHAFIKAFTEHPARLATGFNHLNKVMRALHVRRVFLWPRFHVGVSAALKGHEPEVIEVSQPLTKSMISVQRGVISAMDACLEELQSSTTLAITELKVESSLTGDFDQRIRRQLDPMWNKLPPSTKQIVADLKTLRQMLNYLLRCVLTGFRRAPALTWCAHTGTTA